MKDLRGKPHGGVPRGGVDSTFAFSEETGTEFQLGIGHLMGFSSQTSYQEEILDFIRSRRSIRRYRRACPSVEVVDRIIDCAMYAPSAHNAQPWRFIVLLDKRRRKKLIYEMAKRYRQDLENDGVPETSLSRRIDRSVRLFSGAPVIILACLDMGEMDTYPDQARQTAEMVMGIQSLAAAIQNILLASRALGLGSCWYCAPLFCIDVVKGALNLPDRLTPQALITLGYPAEDPSAPSRRLLHEVRFIA